MEQIQATFIAQPEWLQSLIGLASLAEAALFVNYVLKHVILVVAAPHLDRESKTIDKSAAWLATAAPLLVISQGIGAVKHLPEFLTKLIEHSAEALIVISVAMAMVTALTYANELYDRLPRTRNRPIKGFVQVVKLLV